MDQNSVFFTTALLGIGGFIMMNIKQFFNFIGNHFINIFCYSLKIDESSKFFYSIQKYVMFERDAKIHNYYYRNLYDDYIDGESEEQTLFYNYGYLFLTFQGKKIMINKVNETIQNSMTPYKNVKQQIQLYSFNKKALAAFIKYVEDKYLKDKIYYYFNDNGEIKTLSHIINKTFDNIFLNDNLNQRIIDDLDEFSASEKKYIALGLKYKRTYMFYGEAGTGKSSLSVAMANYTRRDVLSINVSKDMTDAVLIRLIATRPPRSIVLFEDVDCLFDNLDREPEKPDESGKKKDSAGIKITLSCLLNVLDGAYTPNDVIFILTTNHIEKLDSALKRAGRTDVLLEITKPNLETKKKYLSFVRKFKNDENIQMDINDDVTLATLQNELFKK